MSTGTVSADATLLDLPRTVLGLLGLEAPRTVEGFDWAPVLRGAEGEPAARVTYYQAHQGAVPSHSVCANPNPASRPSA